MKPSDIILAKAAKSGEMTKDSVITAILDYLDETWEAEQESIEKLKRDLKPM